MDMLVRRNAFCFHFIRSLIIAFICVSFFLIALQAQEATPSASMPAPEVTKPQITQTPSMQAMSSTFESEVKKESPLTSIGKEADALSLQKCFELAAIRSDTLKISEESIHAAQARLIQAIAELFPTINLVNNQNFQNTYPVKGSAAPIRPYGSSTQLTISQPIFNGFSNYNAIGSANADKANQRHTLQRNYQLLYQDVAQAFYQIISNEGDLIILQQSITTLDSRVKELGDRVKIARSRPSELMQARADLASQKVSLEETKGLLAAAKELMAFYLGIPSEKIHLRETTPFPSVQVLEKYMQTTGTRPDILALVDAERKAQRDVSIEKGALWPQISATGSYNLTNDPGVPEEWAAGFQVQLPLFDGGLIYGRIQEKKALMRQSELNLDNLRRTSDQDVRTAYSNFNSSVAQTYRLKEEVELTAETYQTLLDDYRHGVVSTLDVLTSINNLQSSRRSLYSAEINARLNLIKLHVAAGNAPTTLPGTAKNP